MVCLHSSYVSANVVPIVPPFTYTNLCGSVILTSYIPVYIYMYLISIVIYTSSTYIYCNFIHFSAIPESIQKRLMGVMWSDHDWRNACSSPGILSRKLLIVDNVICNILHHICILLTFGLCCPVLAITIAIYISIYVFVLLAVLGRFFNSLQDREHAGNVWTALDMASYDSKMYISICMWEVVCMSSVFYAFLCWDMASDRTYWKYAVWLPVTAIALPFAMWSSNYIFQRLQADRNKRDNEWYQNRQHLIESNLVVSDDVELRVSSFVNPLESVGTNNLIPNGKIHNTEVVVSPLRTVVS